MSIGRFLKGKLFRQTLFVGALLSIHPPLCARQHRITVMLNPAGDTQHAGRTIEGTFERGIALQFCEQLKKNLETRHSGIRVVLTRIPGETIEWLQNASFSNRLGADLYLSVHFFEKKLGRPTLNIYYFSQNPLTDDWRTEQTPFSFVPYGKAYLKNLPLTKKIAEAMQTVLQTEHSRNFDTCPPLGLPFSPLIGVTAPAIGIEASLRTSHDWNIFIAPMLDALSAALKLKQLCKE